MKNTPLVSVVIPVYNVEEYLPQGLGSLVLQTCKKLEIICVDDGSTDNSLEILNGFAKKDKRIKIIRQKNAGVSVARNSGLKVARGKYVHFMDSDDYVSLNYYEKMVAAAEYANADMAVGGISTSDGLIEILYNESVVLITLEEKVRVTQCAQYGFAVRYLFRRKFLVRNKFRFEPDKLAEDMPFVLQGVKAANAVITVPDVFYHYVRYNSSSLMSVGGKAIHKKRKSDLARTFDARDRFISENGLGNIWPTVRKTRLKLFGHIPFGKILTRPNGQRYFYLFGLKLLKIIP